MLICLVLLSIFLNWRLAIACGLFLGFLKDIFGAYPFGINMILFVLWGYSLRKLSSKLPLEDEFILAGVVFTLAILNSILNRFIFLFCGRVIPLGIFLRTSFIEAIYTAILLPLIYRAFSYFGFFLQDKPDKEENIQEIF